MNNRNMFLLVALFVLFFVFFWMLIPSPQQEVLFGRILFPLSYVQKENDTYSSHCMETIVGRFLNQTCH